MPNGLGTMIIAVLFKTLVIIWKCTGTGKYKYWDKTETGSSNVVLAGSSTKKSGTC